MLPLLLALQAATPAAAPPERISILVPVADQRCTRGRVEGEVVVCAEAPPDPLLPLPAEAAPVGPAAVNPDRSGLGALRAEATPCGATQRGCTTGVNLFAPGSCCEEAGEATNPGLLVRDVAGALRAKKPKRDAVAIDLDEPVMTGRVRP